MLDLDPNLMRAIIEMLLHPAPKIIPMHFAIPLLHRHF